MGRRHSKTWQVCAVTLAVGTALAARAETVVTLTLDDALENQRQVKELLAPWGMKATFFVVSSEVGTTGSLSLEDLYVLEAEGHEVGGHTLHHENLSELSAEQQREQVCADRLRLLSWGLSPTSFAFPFGGDSEEARRAVADCGYNAARDVRGLSDTCSSCPPAESIPPLNAYEVRTPETVTRSHSLEDLQGFVTAAEQAGGGWVVLVFHHVAESCDGYTYCTHPSIVGELAAWLAGREVLGTRVKTFREVMGGELRPAVQVQPQLPTPVLKNASLEEDAEGDGVPDCWQLGGGTHGGFELGRLAQARSGGWAYRLEQSAEPHARRQLAVLRDEGSCAVALRPEVGQRASVWYRASAPLRLVASFRLEDGTWTPFAEGPELPAAEGWTEGRWELPAPPAGALGVSVGAALAGEGWAVVDDFGLTEHLRPLPGAPALPAPAPPVLAEEEEGDGGPAPVSPAPAAPPGPAGGCAGSLGAMAVLAALVGRKRGQATFPGRAPGGSPEK